MQLANIKFAEGFVGGNTGSKLKNAPTQIQRRVPEHRSASLDDAFVRECFVLLLFGNLIDAALFRAEQLTSVTASPAMRASPYNNMYISPTLTIYYIVV